jgi:C-terminal processing protease CtpA/Prc
MRITRDRRYMSIVLLVSALLVVSLLAASAVGAKECKKKGWLGVSLQDLTTSLREAMDISSETGVLVTEVVEDSPADKAGFKDGDIILKFQDSAITSPKALTKLVQGTAPETKARVVILRKGKEKTLDVHIGELEDCRKKCVIKMFGEDDDLLLFDDLALDMAVGGAPGLCMKWLGADLWLGVHPVDLSDQLAAHFGIKDGSGVLINEVVEDSPAEKAGLKAGDVILELGQERIEDTSELHHAIAEHDEGAEVVVTVLRGGKEKKITAVLEKSPHAKEFEIIKEFKKCPGNKHRMKVLAPKEDMVDIYMDWDEELDEDELEELKKEMEELKKEMEELKKNIK